MKDVLMDKTPAERAGGESNRRSSWPRLVETGAGSNDDSKEREEQQVTPAYRIGPYGRRWPVRAA
jgi:hypothetical protein